MIDNNFYIIIKEIRKRWSNLNQEERQPYTAKQTEDKRRYENELNKIKIQSIT